MNKKPQPNKKLSQCDVFLRQFKPSSYRTYGTTPELKAEIEAAKSEIRKAQKR